MFRFARAQATPAIAAFGWLLLAGCALMLASGRNVMQSHGHAHTHEFLEHENAHRHDDARPRACPDAALRAQPPAAAALTDAVDELREHRPTRQVDQPGRRSAVPPFDRDPRSDGDYPAILDLHRLGGRATGEGSKSWCLFS